jgi:hypothetical protein
MRKLFVGTDQNLVVPDVEECVELGVVDGLGQRGERCKFRGMGKCSGY